MRKIKKFNEEWGYNPGKKADHELAEEIVNDLLPRFQKMREEGKQITISYFDKYMKERGASFELSDSVMNILVDRGFDFDIEKDEDIDFTEPYIK
jgi:DNA recombination-dependent growth factor C